MIYKFYRIFAIYIFLIIPISQIFSQENPLSFYPIHIGDWWKYERIDYYEYPEIDTTCYTIKIIGDTIVNGYRYYKQFNSYFTNYLRIDSLNHTVYKLSLSDTSESSLYYLDASEGDTLKRDFYGEPILYCYSEGLKEIFGEEHNVKYFRYTLSWLIDITYSLCEGIGLVSYSDDSHGVWYEDYLIATYIDSILYGNPSVVIDESNTIQTYILYNNYPNPFNSTTKINYHIPKSSFVKLSIYDINGRLIETLINEQKNAGYYSVNWNSSNVSSGIYIYRIDTGEFSSVKKCLVVK